MKATAHLRGRKIDLINNVWVYFDTKLPIIKTHKIIKLKTIKQMKKLLGLLVLLFILASCGNHKSSEAKYIEFCKTDSIVVGYEYAFLYNDSIGINYKVFNPEYPGLSSKDGNFTYADTSDLATLRGYWLCVQQLDKGVPKMPQASREIKLTFKAEWENYIKWRDRK